MRKEKALLARLSLLLCCLLLPPAGVYGQAGPPAPNMARLLEQSGYTYSKVEGMDAWSVRLHGQSPADAQVEVIITHTDDAAVIFALVAEKKQFRTTPELMSTLLVMNDKIDRVKIGLDKDGSLVTRIDTSLRLLDAEELKGNVSQVAAAANEVWQALKPYMNKSGR